MAVFIALVAPTTRTRPAAALELTGNKSFLQEILPYYILFVKDFWREAGEEMLLAAAVCVLKTLQIFFDTSIMKFFFESKSTSPLGVAAELCAIPRTASFLFLCRSLFCRCDFTVECKARQILGQIFSFFFFVAEKFAF